jgi:hypothetical protein
MVTLTTCRHVAMTIGRSRRCGAWHVACSCDNVVRSHTQRAVSVFQQALFVLAASVVLEVIAQLGPPHYSPIGDGEGALVHGPFGMLAATAFCLRGGLLFMLLHAFSLVMPSSQSSRSGNALIAITGAAKLVIPFVAAPALSFLSLFTASIGSILVTRKFRDDGPLPTGPLRALAWLTLPSTCIVTVTAGMQLSFWGVLDRTNTALMLGWIVIAASAMLREARKLA